MSALPSTSSTIRGNHFTPDPILIFGGSARTLDLLRLAVIRSDTVTMVCAAPPSAALKRSADAFAVAMRDTEVAGDLSGAAAVLVALGDVDAENAIVRRARAAGIPVHVADRPLVSDFTLLEFLERHASAARRTTAAPEGVPPSSPTR